MVSATLVAAIMIGVPSPAQAVNIQGGAATVTVAPGEAGGLATCTIARFRIPNGETVTGYTITFPAGTDARGASSAGNTVVVAADNRTVTVTYPAPGLSGPQNNLALTISNVRNPTAAGSYSIASVTFHRTAGGDQTLNLGTGGAYTITPAPYISMTITTPDNPGLLVDFGNVDPAVATAAKQVTVAVDSSAAYTITRTVGGSATALGLTIAGTATGAKPLGTATYTDSYVLTPPWTTDPGVSLTATVVYTVTQ